MLCSSALGAKVTTSHARDDLASGSTGFQHRKALTRLVFGSLLTKIRLKAVQNARR
ncbi:hypothetical protein L842_1230 [Mycobacterium intracellulare MIN_052511_1280]|nr:hypothetical protein L842_1230 [Mycobacterium intracellulare MIN_052511_1280]